MDCELALRILPTIFWLSRASTFLGAQKTRGAAKMVVETGEHPAKLKDMVATPAGTTVEGLFALEQGRLRAILISAVTEATKKPEAYCQPKRIEDYTNNHACECQPSVEELKSRAHGRAQTLICKAS